MCAFRVGIGHASFSASTDSRSDGVSHPDTEADAVNGPDMQRGVSADRADAPASILIPVLSALGSHLHCTCSLVCQRWLSLKWFSCLLSAMRRPGAAAW